MHCALYIYIYIYIYISKYLIFIIYYFFALIIASAHLTFCLFIILLFNFIIIYNSKMINEYFNFNIIKINIYIYLDLKNTGRNDVKLIQATFFYENVTRLRKKRIFWENFVM